MNYVTLKAGDKEYKLRLSTRGIVALEEKLKCNPLQIFGDGETLPTVSAMVCILHASLQELHHGISVNDTYDIFDKWLADGNSATEFIPVILDIYKASGIIKEPTEKN